MLVTNIDEFVEFIPTAIGSEFYAISPFLSEADQQLAALFFGEHLHTHFESLDKDVVLRKTASRLLCLQAYENAIPFVDLVQTENGFAVVKTGNMAPASKERVQKLIDWVSNQLYNNEDMMIDIIMSTSAALAEWVKFSKFRTFTNCLFLTGSDFATYAKCQRPYRKAFVEAKNDLLAWQTNMLEKVISVDYMKQLIEETRANTFTPGAENVIHYCKMILGQMVAGKADEAEKLCNALSNILDKDLATYSTYAGSAEYALRTAPVYENKQTDPTFFFGR